MLLKEEEQFDVTLDQGMKILSEAIVKLEGKELPGDVVFKLYDTYGFPTDLTADIARERELTLDMAGFEVEMEAQRQRARASSKFGSVDVDQYKLTETTLFTGYDELLAHGTVIALFVDDRPADSIIEGREGVLVMNATPFYAESGGQVGDTGRIYGNGITFDVSDTVKAGDAFLHKGKLLEGELKVGQT